MKDLPKVSCLCVTYRRASSLKIAIDCFKNQIYSNKEMVIIYKSNDSDTLDLLNHYDDENIIKHEVNANSENSLGDLRNLSIDIASGEYICIWDDDDWHHPERISAQLNALHRSGKKATALFHILIHDFSSGQSYFSHRRPWEPTIFCQKDIIKELGIQYSPLNRGEDTPFLGDLIRHNLVYPLIKPEIYVYCITGSNTCDRSHFDRIITMSQELSSDHSSFIERTVRGKTEFNEAATKLSSIEFISSFRYLVHYPDELWKYIRYF